MVVIVLMAWVPLRCNVQVQRKGQALRLIAAMLFERTGSVRIFRILRSARAEPLGETNVRCTRPPMPRDARTTRLDRMKRLLPSSFPESRWCVTDGSSYFCMLIRLCRALPWAGPALLSRTTPSQRAPYRDTSTSRASYTRYCEVGQIRGADTRSRRQTANSPPPRQFLSRHRRARS